MKKKLLIILGGALALFIWNAVSWVGLGLHDGGYRDLPAAAAEAMKLADLPASGVYHYPGLPADGDWEALSQRMREGPVVSLMMVRPGGMDPFRPVDFLKGFLFNLVAVILAVYFLSQTRLTAYWPRVLFVALLGAFAVFVVELPTASWYGFPAAFVLPNVVDQLVGWALVGLIAGRK